MPIVDSSIPPTAGFLMTTAVARPIAIVHSLFVLKPIAVVHNLFPIATSGYSFLVPDYNHLTSGLALPCSRRTMP
jgi:hypothetical protein